MDYPWAVPGAWVVCIESDLPEDPVLVAIWNATGLTLPQVGGKYQIYDVKLHPKIPGKVGIRLNNYPSFIVFDIRCFKPLSEKDAEMFNEMLKKLPVMEDEDA